MQRIVPKPQTLWPPDYVEQFLWREEQALRLRADPKLAYGAVEFYREHPIEFIEHWGITFDSRNAGSNLPTFLPFILFQRQRELIEFLLDCIRDQESGLIEKSRDMGATWLCCALSVWLWRFVDGSTIGWGSRKSDLVDRIGIIDSIFEKMRVFIRWLPRELLPRGFSIDEHAPYMRILNPENGSAITGEGGDNIGRGGRNSVYFKDESSHYEHPEAIEAALSENTRVQIDISSVHGLGNVFHRRREAGVEWRPGIRFPKGKTRVFVMDWRDHPAKTQEWYDVHRQKAISEGLLHVHAQEVDRDYAASVVGTIIPSLWVKAAVDAHHKLRLPEGGLWAAALDVADEGGDRNALAKRRGIILRAVDEWGEGDPGETTRRVVVACRNNGPMDIQYDAHGVGAGVKGEANRLIADNLMPKELRLVPWMAGGGVQDPEGRVIPGDKGSPLNKDFYYNLKAQGWWMLRRRFELTYRAVTEKGFTYDPEDLISIDSALPLLRKLEKELSQPTAGQSTNLKLVVNKRPEGTPSPNLADAVMMCYWPMRLARPLLVSDELLARLSMDTNRGY